MAHKILLTHVIKHKKLTNVLINNNKCNVSTIVNAWQTFQYGEIGDLKFTSSMKIPIIRRPNDLLVEIKSASVNVIDILMLQGKGAKLINFLRKHEYGPSFTLEFPLTLGRDFSGVVLAVGKEVKEFQPGDEVWGAVAPQFQGTHSNFCLVQKNAVWRKPKNVSHEEAASLPYAGLTAYSALCHTANINSSNGVGKRALVLGGSGAVGTAAIQLLKAWGVETATTCGSEAAPLVSSLGVDVVIDYQGLNYHQKLKALKNIHVVLDARPAGNRSILEHLSPCSGKCVYVSLTSPLLRHIDQYGLSFGAVRTLGDMCFLMLDALPRGFYYRWGYFMPSQAGIKELTDLIEAEKLRPVIDEVYSYKYLPDAYRKVASGHARGKTVIRMD